MYYFTSDNHFFHANIIKYCNRPFSSVEEMNETMIKRWNSRVDDEDTVFHLGDFGLSKSKEAADAPKDPLKALRDRLNGNIIFISGNHDKNNKNKSIIESLIIYYGGHRIYLTHNPKFYRKDFEWNFTGHCHGNNGVFNKVGKSIIVDLSVDCWDFQPVTINDINQAYSNWKRSGGKNGKIK
jgi:calcineurin-like phosphoesterase family protein